jgi:aminoglycoside 2'-N-acetyltransferase I
MTNESIEIISASEAVPALRDDLRGWFENEFGRADRWASPDYHVLLHLEGQLAGRLGVHDTKVRVADENIRVGGIGGVATKPEFRHRGVASAMLSRAAEFMTRRLNVQFGLLLCRHEVSPVYAKMG